ncbi:hypothetical protein DFR29_12545 [Tahibacter aquaticus]|uniref:Uncharacterized protein n=1 Tax=Tahibacter aquaticus TaxID=520092 RepID=A0A4V3DL25_9GAMM|nr:hypothetical protein DFR29_12545 [Tahibacter aquaticus]
MRAVLRQLMRQIRREQEIAIRLLPADDGLTPFRVATV